MSNTVKQNEGPTQEIFRKKFVKLTNNLLCESKKYAIYLHENRTMPMKRMSKYSTVM